MRTFNLVITAVACFFLAGCGEDKKTPPASGTASGNPLTAPADYVGALGQAQKSAKKTLGGLGLDQALKTFFAEENRFPKDLNELVTKGTIAQIPPAPAGMKYDYDAKTGIVKVVPQ